MMINVNKIIVQKIPVNLVKDTNEEKIYIEEVGGPKEFSELVYLIVL